jgi:hypothetical protein
VFKRQLLGNTVIEFAQSTGHYRGSGSYLMNIFWEWVIEQFLPPDYYAISKHNLSNPWILQLVDNA